MLTLYTNATFPTQGLNLECFLFQCTDLVWNISHKEPFQQICKGLKWTSFLCGGFTEPTIHIVALLVWGTPEERRWKCLRFMSGDWACQIMVAGVDTIFGRLISVSGKTGSFQKTTYVRLSSQIQMRAAFKSIVEAGWESWFDFLPIFQIQSFH